MKGAGSTFVSNLSCDVSEVIAAIVIMKTWGAANQTHRKRVRPNGVHHRVYCGTLSQSCTSILRLCQFCCTILYLCGSVGHMSCLWKSTVPVYSQLSLSNATNFCTPWEPVTGLVPHKYRQTKCLQTEERVYRVPPLSVATESSLLAQQTLTLNANEGKKKVKKAKTPSITSWQQ